MRAIGDRGIAPLMLVVPFFIVVVWHVNNLGIPNSDAANYLATAYEQYLKFSSEPAWHGLASIYNLRGWRPILFPSLAVPFLWLFNGNIVASVGATLSLCYLGWISYSYAIARSYLSPLRAALAAIAITSVPAFVTFSTILFSEMAWLFLCVAFVYHAVVSHRFRRLGHSAAAGLFLGFAMLVRPAETVTVMVIPIAFMITQAVVHRLVRPRDAVLSLAMVSVIGTLLAAAVLVPALNYRFLFPVGAVVLTVSLWALWRSPAAGAWGLGICLAATSLVTLLWWANWMPQLYDWAYLTTFGAMVEATNSRVSAQGLWTLLESTIAHYVGFEVVPIVVAGVIGGIAWHSRAKPEHNPPTDLLIPVAGMLVSISLLYAITGTGENRRAFVGMALSLLVIAIYALGPGILLWTRTLVVAAVAGLQIFSLLASARSDVAAIDMIHPLMTTMVPPPKTTPDYNRDAIRRIVDAGATPGSSVAVYTLGLYRANKRVYEPAALQLAAITLGHPIAVGYLWDVGEYDIVIRRLCQSDYRYLVLDSYDDPNVRGKKIPYVEFTSSLLDRVKNEAPTPGLSKLRSFELGERTHFMFSIQKPCLE